MEKLVWKIGEKMLEKATEQIYDEVSPIILKKFFRKCQEAYLKFALVFDFYEFPLLDDAVQLAESSLMEYKVDVSTLQINGLQFVYFINYEIEEDYLPPDIDIVCEEPECAPSLEYISLMEIMLLPKNGKKRVESREQVEKLIISGVKLLDTIFNQLKEDEKTNHTLKIRSDSKMVAIESDSLFISDIYKRILSELAKSKITHTPYISISKGINGKDSLIIAVNDATIVQLLIHILT